MRFEPVTLCSLGGHKDCCSTNGSLHVNINEATRQMQKQTTQLHPGQLFFEKGKKSCPCGIRTHDTVSLRCKNYDIALIVRCFMPVTACISKHFTICIPLISWFQFPNKLWYGLFSSREGSP